MRASLAIIFVVVAVFICTAASRSILAEADESENDLEFDTDRRDTGESLLLERLRNVDDDSEQPNSNPDSNDDEDDDDQAPQSTEQKERESADDGDFGEGDEGSDEPAIARAIQEVDDEEAME